MTLTINLPFLFHCHSSIALWMIKFIVLEGTVNLVQEKSSVPLLGIERIRKNFALGRRIGFCTTLSALSFSAKLEELWNSEPLSSTRLDPLLFPIPTRTRFFFTFYSFECFFLTEFSGTSFSAMTSSSVESGHTVGSSTNPTRAASSSLTRIFGFSFSNGFAPFLTDEKKWSLVLYFLSLM